MQTFLYNSLETIVLTRWLLLVALTVFGGFAVLLVKHLWNAENGSRKHLIWPAVILVLGLALRGAWIINTQPEPLSDFLIYWQYANAFASGDYTYAELSRHPGVIVLYSWFFNLFGASLTTGWIVNLLFSALMMILMYALGRDIFGQRTGVAAIALTALLPQLVTYTALFASETPAITFFLMVLWAVLYSRDRPLGQKLSYWTALGVMLYGTILLRSSALIFMGLIPLLFVLFRRQHLKTVAAQFVVLAVTTAVLLSTWMGHQNIIGGSPKMFWGGELWLACAIQYDRGGRYTDPKDLAFYDKVKPYYEAGNLVKAYEVIGEESMKVVMADPVKYLANGMVRMKNIIWTSQTGIRWTHRGSSLMDGWSQRYINKFANVSTIIWQILLCLSLLGLVAYRPKGSPTHQEGWTFILAFMAIWTVFHYLLAVASERYSFQIIPFVILFCSGGLASTFSWLRRLTETRGSIKTMATVWLLVACICTPMAGYTANKHLKQIYWTPVKTTYIDTRTVKRTDTDWVQFHLIIDYPRPAPAHVPTKPRELGIPKRTRNVNLSVPIRQETHVMLAHCSRKQFAKKKTVHTDMFGRTMYSVTTPKPKWKRFNLKNNAKDRALYRYLCRKTS